MSRKIWRKLSLVAVSSSMVFGGLGCIGVGDGFIQRLGLFTLEHGIYDTFLAGIFAGVAGGGA